MPRLDLDADHSRSDRVASKTPRSEPYPADSPKRAVATDAEEADLDDVYQEPSRRQI